MEKHQPTKKFRAGAICATIWQNKQTKDGQEFSVSSVSLDRRYTDKSGAWQSTNSLRANDLPKATLVLSKAYEYLMLESGTDSRPTMGSPFETATEEAVI